MTSKVLIIIVASRKYKKNLNDITKRKIKKRKTDLKEFE
jgi:hypothetical protein